DNRSALQRAKQAACRDLHAARVGRLLAALGPANLQPAQLRKTPRGKRSVGRFLAAQAGAPEETRGMTRAQQVARERQPIKKAALLLGPGFITGAADDDPSGIGTYSVAGASLGLATLWTALLTFPLMAAVQNICARLGLVAGHGLAGILRRNYPRPVLYAAVAIVLVANTINLGADLGAIADALGIVSG